MDKKIINHLPAPALLSTQILNFPKWWYTSGLIWIIHRAFEWWRNQRRALNIKVWIQYLWVPMFGVNDRIDRLISLMVRIGQIIFRSFALIWYLLLAFSAIILWIFLPVLIIILIIGQLI